MRLPHVTYEQAKKLKEKGFDEYVGRTYIGTEYCDYIGWKNSFKMSPEHGFNKEDSGDGFPKPMITAPLYVEVMEWFRSKGIITWLSPNQLASKPNVWLFNVRYYVDGKLSHNRIKQGEMNLTHEQAQSECVDYVLENIS